MGNRFSFESDSDLVKLVLRFDSTNLNKSVVEVVTALPIFRSTQTLENGDVLYFFEDSYKSFLLVTFLVKR